MKEGAAMVLETEYNMTLPDYTSYEDINDDSVVPSLPFSAIDTYYRSNDKCFDDKYKVLYKERYHMFLICSDYSL
jgi:hypothetical protein